MSMELWDLLDKDRRPLGQTHPRGRQYPMPHGTYHTVVTVYTVDDRGRLLLTRRAACKGMYPGWWEVTGGSGIAGEDSLTSARRELREETGLRLTAITHVLPPAACTVGIGDERTVCVFGTAEGTFRPSADPMEEIESAWYTRAQVRALHETDLFGSWALAYSWMFANGCLPGV